MQVNGEKCGDIERVLLILQAARQLTNEIRGLREQVIGCPPESDDCEAHSGPTGGGVLGDAMRVADVLQEEMVDARRHLGALRRALS